MKYVLSLLIVMVAGCSSLQYALETAERTRDAMEKAGLELRDAMEVARKARETYIDALKNGDGDRVEAALAAMQAAEIERANRELRFEATQKAFEQASDELERAKAEDNYFEGILGLLFGALVGGGGGFLTGRKRVK
jgi:hypothetical protein